MFNFFKKLFRKSAPKPVVPRVIARAVPAATADPNQSRPQVEVAHLSLAAILSRFPDDLKRNVASAPDPSVTVALPLATIHKQLPSGSVKMSLASLYRQAPVGVFAAQGRVEEKRMVEVPLSEIFRHVKPQGLRRRNDQRRVDLPSDAYELFGDKENPYAIAPAAPEEEDEEFAAAEEAPAAPKAGLKPSEDLRAAEAAFVPPPPAGTPAGGGGRGKGKKDQAGKGGASASTSNHAKVPAGAGESPLVLVVATLCSGWPEPIRSEAMAVEGTTVSLPVAAVTSGVAKGKVTFSWGQIRSWLNPQPAGPTQGREATDLVLPLKVVAPAFLAHSRPTGTRKTFQLDDSIPALFSGGDAAKPAAAPIAPPAPERAKIPAPAAIAAPSSIAAPVLEPAPEKIPPPHAAAAASAPATIGQLLSVPDKEQWSPHELVKGAMTLTGVGGAVIGLHEGLLVAADLPETLKGDTIAAFLPQMFARLNNYTGEMKLGHVDELLFTTNDAHFQAYKLGEIYFAVLGKSNESLPWEGLRLIADELKRQNSK